MTVEPAAAPSAKLELNINGCVAIEELKNQSILDIAIYTK
jgi:hypothetical protein